MINLINSTVIKIEIFGKILYLVITVLLTSKEMERGNKNESKCKKLFKWVKLS